MGLNIGIQRPKSLKESHNTQKLTDYLTNINNMASKKRENELEKLLTSMQTVHSKRMNALLSTLEDDDFIVAYFKTLEYAAPKLQRREISVESKETRIIIEHVTSVADSEEE